MFADAPTSDPLPPKHAPKARAHARGSRDNPKPASESCFTTGTIVAVYGILSRNADTNAETQSISTGAILDLDPSGAASMMLMRISPIFRISPTSPIASTMTNNDAKKRRVSHSTTSKSLWMWRGEDTNMRVTAPKIETHATFTWCSGCSRNARITAPNTMPVWTRSCLFLILNDFPSWSTYKAWINVLFHQMRNSIYHAPESRC